MTYGCRKQITITNNAGSSLSSGYSACVTENTASLISAGKMLSNGNDLRIVYWNSSSSSWVELDRDVLNLNTSSTKIWFKTQASIAASGSDSNYYMYYNCPNAGSPPTNNNNVYLFYNDFGEGTIDSSKWAIVSGIPTAENGQLNLQGSVELRSVASFARAYVWEQDISAQADGQMSRVCAIYADSGNNYHAHVDSYGFRLHRADGGFDTQIGNTAPYVRPSNHLLRFTITSNTIRVELLNKADSSVTWDTGTVTDSTQTGTRPIAFRYSQTSGTIHYHHDNIKVRSYVSPEPTTSQGTEELSPYASGTVPTSLQSVDSDYVITRSHNNSVSTEYVFSNITTYTPSQLNFTVVNEYDAANISVTIQVWNYSSSSYASEGEGYLAYNSTSVNETKLLSITANPQFYVSGGNAKIKVTGTSSNTTQFQQKINQLKLDYGYNSSPNYDYILKIANQVTDAWKINLISYNSSNITRLSNATISLHDGTVSDQIRISNGTITQSEGQQYNLSSSATVYMSISNLQANTTETSYLHIYLKVLVPNTSSYHLLIVTIEIT